MKQEKIQKRIQHANARIAQFKAAHGDNPLTTHSYYGGWSLGYWEGVAAAYEAILDTMNEEAE